MTNPIGEYIEMISARATDPEILKKAQDGGIVTAAYVYGLENGLLDGVIVADTAEGFKPVPKIARTREEVLSACGTKYSVCPNVSVVKNAVKEYALEKVGFVGTPCQIIAMKKMMQYPNAFRETVGNIGLIIGIYCMENFPYNGIKTLVEEYASVQMSDVLKTDIGKGKLFVYPKDGSEAVTVPIKETIPFEQKSCHVCMDYTAELADIATGSVGSPDGWSTVVIRNKRGKDFMDKMLAAGILETRPLDMESKGGYPLLEKLSDNKKAKNAKEIERRIEMGLPVPY
ncbi:MAG: coenzyme F420 hydrogenase subunit beta [Methanosarcinales archaeon]|jgi:coenzyme F420 hydrogenase subunit beta|nr:coenzyme F420 hydrogenase subunit beta [Methanosarcinales archaeon]